MELAKGRMQEIVETESDFELLPYFKKQFSFCLFLFDLYEKFWLPGTETISDAEVISDADALILARDIAKKIESEMEYPGQTKVNVIRETRSVEFAK